MVERMISFTIDGKPQAKQRPRHGNGFTYTPKETVQFENWVRLCFRQSNQEKMDGELVAELTFVYAIPKSKVKQAREGACPTTRPDIDNLAKSVLDSLNGIAYDDDSQIVELHARKVYGEPKTIVVIRQKGE